MIDQGVFKLFNKEFLEMEMSRHGIQSIKESWTICQLRGNPMVALPVEKIIYVDIEANWQAARRRLNWPSGNILAYDSRSYATPVSLKDETEAQLFIFFHECKHVEDPNAEEWEADKYARRRILEWRKGK